jgi:hypothetical protein
VLSHHVRNHTSNRSGLTDLIDVASIGADNKELVIISLQVTKTLMTTLVTWLNSSGRKIKANLSREEELVQRTALQNKTKCP